MVSDSGSSGLSRRLVLGGIAALPVLPGLLDAAAAQAQAAMPLASWNEGPAKQAILDFIKATTDPSNKDFVPPKGASRPSIRTARYGSSIRSLRKSSIGSTACL